MTKPTGMGMDSDSSFPTRQSGKGRCKICRKLCFGHKIHHKEKTASSMEQVQSILKS